jgi:hypothetical protein
LSHLLLKPVGGTGIIATMSVSDFQAIRDSLRQLYLEDPRPWLVGFSGGKSAALDRFCPTERDRVSADMTRLP